MNTQGFKAPTKGMMVGALLGIAILLFAFNYLSVTLSGYPFAYCGGRWLIYALGVHQLWGIGFTIAAIWFGLTLFTRHYRHAVVPVIVVTMMTLIPAWADTMFRLGGSCGGEAASMEPMDWQDDENAPQAVQVRPVAPVKPFRQAVPLPPPKPPPGGLY